MPAKRRIHRPHLGDHRPVAERALDAITVLARLKQCVSIISSQVHRGCRAHVQRSTRRRASTCFGTCKFEGSCFALRGKSRHQLWCNIYFVPRSSMLTYRPPLLSTKPMPRRSSFRDILLTPLLPQNITMHSNKRTHSCEKSSRLCEAIPIIPLNRPLCKFRNLHLP